MPTLYAECVADGPDIVGVRHKPGVTPEPLDDVHVTRKVVRHAGKVQILHAGNETKRHGTKTRPDVSEDGTCQRTVPYGSPYILGLPYGPPYILGLPYGSPYILGLPYGSPYILGLPYGPPYILGLPYGPPYILGLPYVSPYILGLPYGPP